MGDSVLVLLPIPGEFKAKFTGPGIVRRKVNEYNYEVELPGRRKKVETFHVNLLKPYVARVSALQTISLASKIEDDNLDIPGKVWKGDNSEVLSNLDKKFEHLSLSQAQDLKDLINAYPSLFRDTPGLVSCIEHNVFLKPDAKPVRQAPYRLSPQKA